MNYKKIWKENWDLVLAVGIFICGFIFAGRLANLFLGSMNRSGEFLGPAIKLSLAFFGITLIRNIVLKGLPKWRWWFLIGAFLLGLFLLGSAFGGALI